MSRTFRDARFQFSMLPALVCWACSSGPGSAEDLVGVARAQVTLAPTGVQCLRIQAQGTSTVTQQFLVTEDASSVFDISGLPLGTDTFTATAFNVACSATTGASPTFASQPVMATVTAATPVTLVFSMLPVGPTSGGGKVALDFAPATRGVVTEFPLVTAGAIPGDMVAGPAPGTGGLSGGGDGPWFTELGTDASAAKIAKIAHINSAGGIVEFPIAPVPVDGSTVAGATLIALGITVQNYLPTAIASAPDGNLWVLDANDGLHAVQRITPNGVISTVPVPGGSTPIQIAVGPDGNLWFTEQNSASTDHIGRVTLSGTLTEFSVGVQSGVFGIAAGPDGNVWFTEQSGKIGRITPNGTISEFGVPNPSGAAVRANNAFGIATGPDGNIWFTEVNANKIGRINPSGSTVTEFALPTLAASPENITVGPDGNLWFTEFSANQIGRITPQGTVTEFPIPTFQSGPTGIAAGLDGNIWFTEQSIGQIGRITP